VWGSLVSLNRATSSKSHFDVARLLISTSIPDSTSAKIPVSIEGSSFLVFVVEEFSGETILSRGLDRSREGTADRGVNTSGSSCSSATPTQTTTSNPISKFPQRNFPVATVLQLGSNQHI
ncbi:hypothetical protein Ancab_038129, partial [Ancistrocladus abbreviatus]